MRENYAAEIYDFRELDQLCSGGSFWAGGAQVEYNIMHDKFVCHCRIIISAGPT